MCQSKSCYLQNTPPQLFVQSLSSKNMFIHCTNKDHSRCCNHSLCPRNQLLSGSQLWGIRPKQAANFLVGKEFHTVTAAKSSYMKMHSQTCFQEPAFSSCHNSSQLQSAFCHVKYFIRLEWDPNSQWGYSA